MAAVLPEAVAKLFWEVDPSAIDLDNQRDYVLERVITRGGWDAMRWVRATFSRDQLADFLARKGSRLPPRELAYWCAIAEIELPIARGGGRPAWAGP